MAMQMENILIWLVLFVLCKEQLLAYVNMMTEEIDADPLVARAKSTGKYYWAVRLT